MDKLPDSALFLINQYAGERYSTNLLEDIKYKIVDNKLNEFKVKIEEQFMLYRNFIDQEITFEEYIHTIINNEKKLEYLHFFSNCECCERHSNTGKVRLYQKKKNIAYLVDENLYNIHSNIKQCTCPCRHFKRFIERSMRL